jgi:uncharacterized protein with HEPN domain
MDPRDADAGYLLDIFDSARFAQEYVEGIDEHAFESDRRTRSAVIYEILIIGEAAKKVSAAFKAAHPEIPWRAMAGMRDVMIHDYRDVDVPSVWATVTESIPALIAALETLVSDMEAELDNQGSRSDDA